MAMCTYCNKKYYNCAPDVKTRTRLKRGPRPKKLSYRFYKKAYCEVCDFRPEYIGQLDVDHIDGNHKNNNPDNLQTLCANCHRLKTYQQRDGIFKHL